MTTLRQTSLRFSATQLDHLRKVFLYNVVGFVVGDHVRFLCRWLHGSRGNGHTVSPMYWTPEAARLLCVLITTVVRLRTGKDAYPRALTKQQIAAYEDRHAWLMRHFDISAVDLLALHGELAL